MFYVICGGDCHPDAPSVTDQLPQLLRVPSADTCSCHSLLCLCCSKSLHPRSTFPGTTDIQTFIDVRVKRIGYFGLMENNAEGPFQLRNSCGVSHGCPWACITQVEMPSPSSVIMPHTILGFRVSFQENRMCDHVRFTFKCPLSY